MFFDSEDYFKLTMCARAVAAADEHNAQVVVFVFVRFDENGKETLCDRVRPKLMKHDISDGFSYVHFPDQILSAVSPVSWNKLSLTQFILEKSFKFDEIFSTNDVTFASLSVAAANKAYYLRERSVHYRSGHANTITATKFKNLGNLF